MLGFRCSPFSREESLVDFMISFVAREAECKGSPLTEAEKAMLRQGGRSYGDLPVGFRSHMEGVISGVIQKDEPFSGQDPRTFLTALEWSEMEDAAVIYLAEAVICAEGHPGPALHGRSKVKDTLLCVGCGLVVVVLMFIAVGVLGYLGILK